MADKMLRVAFRDQNGIARPPKTDELGNVQVHLIGNNVELSSGTISGEETAEIAFANQQGMMVAIKGSGNEARGEFKLDFEHHVSGIGWLPWKDGFGEEVSIPLKNNSAGVYGPFHGFPFFEKGRIKLSVIESPFTVGTINVAKDKTYQASTSDNIFVPAWAFNETLQRPGFGGYSSYWASTAKIGSWVGVDLGEETAVARIRMFGANTSACIQEFQLQGTNVSFDAPTDQWDTVLENVLLDSDEYQEWDVTKVDKYRYYRVLAISNYGSNVVRSHDIRLFPATYDASPFQYRLQGVL